MTNGRGEMRFRSWAEVQAYYWPEWFEKEWIDAMMPGEQGAILASKAVREVLR